MCLFEDEMNGKLGGEVLGGEVRVLAPSTIVRFSFGEFAAEAVAVAPPIRRHRANSWKLALAWSREENRREKRRLEQNRTEQNRTEQNRTEQNRAEQSGAERSRVEEDRPFLTLRFKCPNGPDVCGLRINIQVDQ